MARRIGLHHLLTAAIGAAGLFACGQNNNTGEQRLGDEAPAAAASDSETRAHTGDDPASRRAADLRIDKFSYANFDEIRVRHAELDLTADFETRTLAGTAILELDYPDPGARRLVLDTDDLTINGVEARIGDVWEEISHILGPDDPALGAKMMIDLPEGAEAVLIDYATSPNAAGLQWVEPEATAGKQLPFMYSQAQAIHARSILPIQDTPAIRITYAAHIKTPPSLMAVMGARQDTDTARDGDYTFEMPQPIPPYLIAIAIGDLAFQPIGDHMGVYAEDYIVAAARDEFADTPQMEEATAALYGPYRWGRYDMIVLPPSFPFGGMENPRLSFLTPTLVAGDKSLTNVVAHELAHSWSGNLVTNATWRDAWLNEGVTSYVENRVMEALYGAERAVMERALDKESLAAAIAEAERPALTRLKLPTDMQSTDDAFTQIAYVKGAFFLKFLETRFGRDAFDPFLKAYFDHYAFKSIVTEDFLTFLKDNLMATDPGAVSDAEINDWVYGEGMPETIESPRSDRFAAVDSQRTAFLDGAVTPSDLETQAWTTHEWLHFINGLPDGTGTVTLAALDDAFSLSTAGNAEIAYAFYMKAIPADYAAAFDPLEAFLLRVGRGKFIYRLYAALAESNRAGWAREVYAAARPGYHPIAQSRIDAVFGAVQ